MAYPVADSYNCASGGVISAGRSAIPAWLPAIGTIVDISVNNIDGVRGADNLTQTRSIMDAWSGGVFAPALGAYGSMIFTGGGHSDGFLNSVYRYDIETRAFSKIKDAANYFFDVNNDLASQSSGWMWSDAAGTTEQIGEPFAAHLYANIVYLPADPSGVSGYVAHAGRCAMPIGGNKSTPRPMKLALGSQKFTHCGTDLTNGGATFGCAAHDSLRNRLIGFSSSNISYASYANLSTGVSSDLALSTPASGYGCALFYDVASDLYLLADLINLTLRMINPSTGLITSATLSGASPVDQGGFEWVESWGSLVYYDGSSNDVFTLKRPLNPLTGTWAWAKQTLTGTPLPKNANPHYTRFLYSPRVDCFFWASKTSQLMQAFRLAKP